MMKRFWVLVLSFGVALASGLSGAGAGEILKAPPANPDPSAYYIFYLHGTWLEDHRETEPNRQYGTYLYSDILKALADQDLVVISELRGRVRPREYVAGLVQQITGLLDAGVSSSHITVSGFSKGGAMTLQAGATLHNKNINFVVLSGCGIGQYAKSYQGFLNKTAARMRGRFLSLFDTKDTDGGTCQEAFDKAGLPDAAEIILHDGSGHGVFYRPNTEWIEPLARWAKGAKGS